MLYRWNRILNPNPPKWTHLGSNCEKIFNFDFFINTRWRSVCLIVLLLLGRLKMETWMILSKDNPLHQGYTARDFSKEQLQTLVWGGPTRAYNITLPQKILTDEIHETVRERIVLHFHGSLGRLRMGIVHPMPRHPEKRWTLGIAYMDSVQPPSTTLHRGTPLPRINCRQTLDLQGDHIPPWWHGAHRIDRNDTWVESLAQYLARAALYLVAEPRHGLHRTKLEIQAMGSRGRTVFKLYSCISSLHPTGEWWPSTRWPLCMRRELRSWENINLLLKSPPDVGSCLCLSPLLEVATRIHAQC